MKVLSDRIVDIQQGDIRKMFDLAAGYDHVINMGIGEPDMATDPSICHACGEAVLAGRTHYTPTAGLAELRRKVSEISEPVYGKYDAATEVIITNGGMGALSMLIATVIDPGDEVLVQDPQWLNYIEQIKLYGGIPVRVPTNAENNFCMTAEEIEKHITSKSKLLLINSPNNPTGSVMSDDELEKIAEIAVRHDILVASDEVYSTLYYGEKAPLSISSFPGMRERCIVVNSLSKAYAMTGWRVGYALAPAVIIDKMIKLQENLSSCPNGPGQYAALYALDHPEITVKLREKFTERREYLYHALCVIPGIHIAEPMGAFYTFPDIHEFGITSSEFSIRLLKEKQVVCIPGNAFGSCGEGYVRMTYTADIPQLEEAVRRIKEFLDTLR